MSHDLSPLLQFWGLNEEELNGEVFLSTSSIFSRSRRLTTTLSYSEFSTSTSKAESYRTADHHERTLQRHYDQEQVEVDSQNKSTRVTVPHVSEEAESCGYETNTMESTSTVGIVCVNCAHCNVGGVNWCLECGTAVTGAKSQPLLDSSSHSQSQTPNSIDTHQFNTLDIMPTKFHSSVKSCPQLSAEQFASNLDVLGEVSNIRRCRPTSISSERHLVRTDSTHSRRKLVFSVKSPPGQYTSRIQTSNGRCWNTSGLYMWRKPSSLKSMQSLPCGNSTLAEPGYQTKSSDSLYNKVRNLIFTVSLKSCIFTLSLDSLAL